MCGSSYTADHVRRRVRDDQIHGTPAAICGGFMREPIPRSVERVLISVDMEGVAGVVAPDDMSPGHAEYERNRTYMTNEASAAVRGILAYEPDASAVVCDSHAGYRNVLPDRLDRKCTLMSRRSGVPVGTHRAILRRLRLSSRRGPEQRLGHDDVLAVEGQRRAAVKLVTERQSMAYSFAEIVIVEPGQYAIRRQSIRRLSHWVSESQAHVLDGAGVTVKTPAARPRHRARWGSGRLHRSVASVQHVPGRSRSSPSIR